jgi:hypothetical protein
MSQGEALEFEAVLWKPEGVGTGAFITAPFAVAEVYGVRGQVKIRGTINGFAFRSLLMPMGDGKRCMCVNRAIRDAIGVGVGDSVQVCMERDTEERTVAVPEDFQAELDRCATVKARFERLAYTHRKEFVQAICAAKRPDTRARRIANIIAQLADESRKIQT